MGDPDGRSVANSIVHLIRYGRPICKFTNGLLSFWPKHHLWVGLDVAEMVKEENRCLKCYRTLYTVDHLVALRTEGNDDNG